MLTYKELFDKVSESLDSNVNFSIEVETNRRRGVTETDWCIYIEWAHDGDRFYHGATAQAAFDEFKHALRELDEESLDETSAAVGDAEVAG